MIGGITHLTMESDLSRGIAFGSDLGFALDFISQVELPDDFEGIGDGSSTLPLAVLVQESGIRLEVVEHRTRNGELGAYSGVFRNAPSDVQGSHLNRPAIRDLLMQAGILHDPQCIKMGSGGEAWFDGHSAGAGFAGIVSRSGDVAADAEFWRRFARAKWTTVEDAWAVGTVPGVWSQMSCALVIVQRETESLRYSMNNIGFPSLGVFSTDISRDLEKAGRAGATLRAPTIVTEVNNRQVSMALVETPGGNPVELLSTVRAAVLDGCD